MTQTISGRQDLLARHCLSEDEFTKRASSGTL
jgi:hypothetical protein